MTDRVQQDTKVKIDQTTDAKGQDVTVLRFSGDIAKTSREAVLGSYESLPKDVHVRLLLDFTNVEYLNSSGIALVIEMMMAAGKAGQKIQVFGLTPHFQKVFRMVGITKYADLHPDEGSAKASF